MLGTDDDAHPRNRGMTEKCLDRMAKHRPAGERQVLLWHLATKAGAGAGGDDEGDGVRHGTRSNWAEKLSRRSVACQADCRPPRRCKGVRRGLYWSPCMP